MKKIIISLCIIAISICSIGQQFEPSQVSGDDFDKLKVNVGGDFAIQYQILDHNADSALIPLGSGINLPTANLNLNVDLAKGVKLNLVTYLSSRRHNEAWVKGGYLQIDELPFIKSSGVDKVMDYLTIWVGDMELNYGDEHFRRSDNGNVTRNPFVGNYVMEAFMTSPAFEAMFRNKGIIAMGGITLGVVNPALTRFSASTNQYTAYDAARYLAYYWKAGYDRQFNDDFRGRLTLSGYHAPKHYSGSLYNGDRAGSRYYLVMNRITNAAADVDIKSNATTGNWGPGSTNKDNSLMVNLFVKAKGFEVFSTYEIAKGTYVSGKEFKFSQIAAEGLYRFGGRDQFYGGLRYNLVNGDTDLSIAGDQSVNRIQVAAGWFMLESTVVKVEYVNQSFTDFIASYGADAGFNGVMIEAAISF